ncbi:hypothetical protein AB0I81_35290 [Nonomuraea sp. NPDC050404]|uniref:hypothetical protein n=1 Tax=Nonomuraea sp. NPDC050404 TaxID=3155783 RepID=UPI0033F92824
MRFASPRRLAVAALVAGGLTVLAAPAAHAFVDPAAVLMCLAETPTALAGGVDPTALTMPELTPTNCLAP